MLKFHVLNKFDITLLTASHITEIPYGCCILNKDNKSLKTIIEKPKYKNNVNIGLYILNKRVLKLLKKNQPINFDLLINKVLKKKIKSVGVYKIKPENWYDIGNWDSFKDSIDKFEN